jgi:hypothetical protein
MTTMRQRLDADKLSSSVVIGPEISALLDALEILDPVAPGIPPETAPETGHIKFQVAQNSLGVFDLNLSPPIDPRPYTLTYSAAGGIRTGFRLAIALAENGIAQPLFDLIEKIPGYGFVAAERKTDPDGSEWLEAAADPAVHLTGIDPALVITGKSGEPAHVLLAPSRDGPDGLLVLGLTPSTVLLGGTGFGLEITDGIAFDDTGDAVPAGKTLIDGEEISTPADNPAWRGIAVRNARFYLPKGAPLLGGHAVDAHLEIGKSPSPGIDLLVTAKVPPVAGPDGRPGISVRIECQDPTATGLSGFVPTMVEAAMELPLDQNQQTFGGGAPQTITFAAGKPVIVRARFSRLPQATPPETRISLAVEAQGDAGIVSVSTDGGGLGAKILVTAATLATALVADGKVGAAPAPGGDGTGVWLHEILTAAVGLSSFLHDTGGGFVLHGAELISEGNGLPVGGVVKMKIDYSVSAVVDTFSVGVISVGMQPDRPFRVRVREVMLTVDPAKRGLQMINLGYDHASLEVEDPGGWEVQGPGSLFDVLGTRSGRGSMWIEVDLRFKLDLGPVKVSGATIRGTLNDAGHIEASLRGLDAALDLSPAIDGQGAFHMLSPSGFDAHLAANIQPLMISADAGITVQESMVELFLGVDLPGPIPLGTTGLGLYGIGGLFVINGRPTPAPAGSDAVTYQLNWDYHDEGSFTPDSGQFTFGLEAVVGTAGDMGFTFSSRAGLFLTLPDIAVRGALNGRVLAPRATIVRGDDPDFGIRAKGVVVVDAKDGVTIGIEGSYVIPHLLEVRLPLGARFPKSSPDWYIYLGADGPNAPPGQGREIGPVRSTILPGILDQYADAYLMFRGQGIKQWPRGGPLTVSDGFVIAFGFGFGYTLGIKPIVWAEVHASADILVATHPLLIAGFGALGGSLNLGPFSIGVDAQLQFSLGEGQDFHLYARLCGHIDLFFTSIEGCVDMSFGSDKPASLPPPNEHPLDRVEGTKPGQSATMIDDRYRTLAPMGTDANSAPTFWPDSLPHLCFSAAPTLALGAPQFPTISPYPEGLRALPLGSDLLSYQWSLDGITLLDVTDNPDGDVVPGPLSGGWQVGKFGDAGGQPEPAELVLLTPQRDLWIDRVSDAGASLPNDPLKGLAQLCQTTAVARLGWALGAGAEPVTTGLFLPPDPVSADPLQSRVEGTMQFIANAFNAPLSAATALRLPVPTSFAPAHVVGFDAPLRVEREFDAYLLPGQVVGPPGYLGMVLGHPELSRHLLFTGFTVTLDDALLQGRMWLIADVSSWLPGMVVVTVTDDQNSTWTLDTRISSENDLTALRYIAPAAAVGVRVVTVRWVVGFTVGYLGLGGITASAKKAADARNSAAASAASAAAAAAAAPPPAGSDPPSAMVRSVLQPGRLYRLDVAMSWTGTLYERGDSGKTVLAAQTTPQTTYAPKDPAASTSTARSFYFRTTKKPVVPSSSPKYGSKDLVAYLYRKADLFDPTMLQRYLAGYEPGQSELDRFCDDPLSVHFTVAHAAVLADRYGFKLQLGLRRTDAAGADGEKLVLDGVFTHLLAPEFARGSDVRRIDLAMNAPCAVPTPGSTMRAPAALAPQAWYEVYAQATSNTAGVNDGSLPGVTFRTSRWRTPAEMMAALQFPASGSGIANGDLEILPDAPLTAGSIEGEDAAFDAFLAQCGLEGWPVATAPRVSRMWKRDPAAVTPTWLFVGLIIESPEGIHRAGRFEIGDLTLTMGLVPPNIHFDIRRRDRSGSRIILATSTPFKPLSWRVPNPPRPFPFPLPRPRPFKLNFPTLTLHAVDRGPSGTPAPGVAIAGTISLPIAPDFAVEEAS